VRDVSFATRNSANVTSPRLCHVIVTLRNEATRFGINEPFLRHSGQTSELGSIRRCMQHASQLGVTDKKSLGLFADSHASRMPS
jgi:hypothetical protein